MYLQYLVIVSVYIYIYILYTQIYNNINKYIKYITVLSIDAMDTTGEQHLQIEHNIFKRRLDLNGKPIEDPQRTGDNRMTII